MEREYLLQVCGLMDQGLVGFGTQPLLAVIPGVLASEVTSKVETQQDHASRSSEGLWEVMFLEVHHVDIDFVSLQLYNCWDSQFNLEVRLWVMSCAPFWVFVSLCFHLFLSFVG